MFTLDRMELHGFKSFFGRTAFEFKPGIIAVVGPNGCGKSNIGDAISWVLGDQSPRSLRADRMADVIFNGSEARRPLGMAEVTLKFMSTNGSADKAEEFSITRRLFRDGNSEYSLNGLRCRLKDIQDMLARSQVGSRLYSVIEQGKVDLILTAKPKDRRGLFEEAAGIMGYKAKRRVALGKLEATQANLLRINDILTEVSKQAGSLRRQVAKARRYQRLQETIRTRRGWLLRSKLADLERETETSGTVRRELADREAAHGAALARGEADVESIRRRTDEGDDAIRRDRERLSDLVRAIDRDHLQRERSREQKEESLKAILRWSAEAAEIGVRLSEREADLQQRSAGMEERRLKLAELEESLQSREQEQKRRMDEVEGFQHDAESTRVALLASLDAQAEARADRDRIGQERQRLAVRLKEIEEERCAAISERDAREVEIEELEALTATRGADLEATRRERASVEETLASEIAALQSIAAGREELAATIAALEERARALEEAAGNQDEAGRALETVLQLNAQGKVRSLGRAADALEVDPQWVPAAEAAFGELLGAAVMEGDEDIVQAVRLLREESSGRGAFLAAHPAIGSRPEIPEELATDSRCLGPLASKVALRGSYGRALEHGLRSFLIAADLAGALELHARHPGWSFVTSQGDLVRSSGLVHGGAAPPEERGILSRRHLQEELAAQLAARRDEQVRLEAHRASGEARRASLEERSTQLEERQREQDRLLVEARLLAAQRGEDRQRAEKAAQLADQERGRVEREGAALETGGAAAEEALQAAELRRKALEERLSGGAELLAEQRAAMTSLAESLGSFRSEVGAQREAIRREEEGLEAWVKAAGEERERLERARAEAAGASELVRNLEASMTVLEESLRQSEEERGALGARVEASEMEAATRRQELAAAEQAARSARGELEETRRKLGEAEVEAARLEVELKHLEAAAREEIGGGLEDLRARPLPEGEISVQAIEEEIAAMKGRLERLGAVNLAALEQYREMDERTRFLADQKKDLEEAIESLNDSIRKINRTSREKFLEAFTQIQESFNRSFVTLFGGGKAELRLMEDEDVLECGIDVIASPPGKRLQNITLMSGGEKAMTAVALLFALFRYRPSPFCILDEVDAPLDEANVGRFTRMLRELTPETQFILITHNRRSMEAADLLYGITMEEPGVSKVVSLRLDH
ncbi:MAG TPA: chromosome segregation protein SMC [Candidatus Polarisedimenticolia bacterium]|nr:chromosome segregation protein SMC [Candidatus Polarisedimenticolia bacterium]